MSKVVLDSSAVLAFIQEESGGDQIAGDIQRGIISAANYGEIVGRLRDKGASESDADALLTLLELDVRPFTATQARFAGHLRPATRAFGLSLGDRACLALASELGATALTGDRDWLRVPPEMLGTATVEVFR